MGSGLVPKLCLLVLLVHVRAAQHSKAAQGKERGARGHGAVPTCWAQGSGRNLRGARQVLGNELLSGAGAEDSDSRWMPDPCALRPGRNAGGAKRGRDEKFAVRAGGGRGERGGGGVGGMSRRDRAPRSSARRHRHPQHLPKTSCPQRQRSFWPGGTKGMKTLATSCISFPHSQPARQERFRKCYLIGREVFNKNRKNQLLCHTMVGAAGEKKNPVTGSSQENCVSASLMGGRGWGKSSLVLHGFHFLS